jgi:hypothetical protein
MESWRATHRKESESTLTDWGYGREKIDIFSVFSVVIFFYDT